MSIPYTFTITLTTLTITPTITFHHHPHHSTSTRCVSEYALTLTLIPTPTLTTNPHPHQTQRKLVFCLSEEEGGTLFKLPLGRGVAGLCAATNRAVNIVDCANDARFDGSTDKAPRRTTNPLALNP